jgi:hypothetical protein
LLFVATAAVATADGFCGPTVDEVGDCEAGNSGSWQMDTKAWHRARATCRAHCASCSRCRFISYSLHHNDCSWHARYATLRGCRRRAPARSWTSAQWQWRIRARPSAWPGGLTGARPCRHRSGPSCQLVPIPSPSCCKSAPTTTRRTLIKWGRRRAAADPSWLASPARRTDAADLILTITITLTQPASPNHS